MVARVLDTVLRSGKAVFPDGATVEADIGIAGGRIAAIAAPGALAGVATVDLKSLLVMPGVVDAHIHLGHGSDISRPRAASDAETESAAAAAGGVTTFISYVISGQPFEPALIDEICAVTAAGSRVDFGLHLVISTEEQLARVPDYAKAYGIPSFKLFMYSRGGEGLRIGLPDIDDGFLFRLAEAVVRCQGILCPHCENIEVAWVLGRRLMAADPARQRGPRRLEWLAAALCRGRGGSSRCDARAAGGRSSVHGALHLCSRARGSAGATQTRHRPDRSRHARTT